MNARDYRNGSTVTRLWNGVWEDEDVKAKLLTVTTYDSSKRPNPTHKSQCGDLAWRTCHDKLLKGGVFKDLKL